MGDDDATLVVVGRPGSGAPTVATAPGDAGLAEFWDACTVEPTAEHVASSARHVADAVFGDEVKRRIMIGTYALSAGYYDAYYRKHNACVRSLQKILRKDS